MDPTEYLNRQRFDQQMAIEEQRRLTNNYREAFDQPINIWLPNQTLGGGYGTQNILGNSSGSGNYLSQNGALLAITLPIIVFGVAVLIFAGYALHKYSQPEKTHEPTDYEWVPGGSIRTVESAYR
jgi:hypothetical protein